jgi:hypothetical protein
LKKAKSPFSVELNPKNTDIFEKILTRKSEQKGKDSQSLLFNNSKAEKVLKALGYDDIEYKT